MFSGIIEQSGIISHIAHKRGRHPVTLTVRTTRAFIRTIRRGASVAVNGICLTVVSYSRLKRAFTVNVVDSTRDKTTVVKWSVGDTLNLEQALSAQSMLNGHIVQGHVTGTARVTDIVEDATQSIVTFAPDGAQMEAIVPAGSIAINGISLTVAKCQAHAFQVALIPYTRFHTNVDLLSVGSQVNIETDIIARTIAHYHNQFSQNAHGASK